MTIAASLSAADKLERLAAYRAARDKAVAWLLRQLNPDGSIGDPRRGFDYYRAPWTFTVVGETAAATASCAWTGAAWSRRTAGSTARTASSTTG